MLPAILAQDVKKQLLHYLEATFDFRHADEEQALREFLLHPSGGLFKGLWVQLRRPFHPAAGEGRQFFDLPVPFQSYRHQWQAWERLSSKEQAPKSTIITTGTESGKTECFFSVQDIS